jgi:5'-nucleotidase
LILVTNDDGFESLGLQAAVRVALRLGEPLVVAPSTQQTGMGRGFSRTNGVAVHRRAMQVDGRTIDGYAVDGAPALAVTFAILELAPRAPAIAISGINYGENLGNLVTASGTVGAALEAADLGVPAVAMSLETPQEYHYSTSGLDFRASEHFAGIAARMLLRGGLPQDVDALNVNVPSDATPNTPWRVTRVSRSAYYYALPSLGARLGESVDLLYESRVDRDILERDSDIWAVRVDRVVSVSPISLDITSRTDLHALQDLLREMARRNGATDSGRELAESDG